RTAGRRLSAAPATTGSTAAPNSLSGRPSASTPSISARPSTPYQATPPPPSRSSATPTARPKTMAEVKHTPGPEVDFEAVAAGVLDAIRPVVEREMREAANQLYGATMEAVQDYLSDNLNFN